MGMGWKTGLGGIGIALSMLGYACSSDPGALSGARENPSQVTSGLTTAGALVRMDMSSTVGVLLDDLPLANRDAAAAAALAQPASFWTDRATRQARLTYYRLAFRGGFYTTTPPKGPLPLPPDPVWHIQLTGRPQRATIGGHDLVVVNYSFNSYILSDTTSPGIVEPSLGTVGGTWDEPFNLPIDPELLLQRTGYACMDEFEYPAGSVFEENAYYFYDQTCTAGSKYCHVTNFPSLGCGDALEKYVGNIKPELHFARVAYDATLASQFRVGTVTPATQSIATGAADLAVVQEPLRDEHRIAYRFFGPGSCDLGEGTIAQLGWRRLLMFSAVVRNDGTGPVHIGNVTDPTNPWVQAGAFEYSACHKHYHFSHYGSFSYNGLPGSKRAFCLEDTNRYHNDEVTPLTAVHQSCEYQGIGAGWGDEYQFGLPGQWVDITATSTSATSGLSNQLTFVSNKDQYMCEGALGSPLFPVDASGKIIFGSKPNCTFFSGWGSNNSGSVTVTSPGGSFVTEACTRGQIGPKRDCGFTDTQALHSCASGSTVRLKCSTTASTPQVLRLCERSAQLGVGVACTLADSAANALVDSGGTNVTFACPAVRDAALDTSGNPTTSPGVGGYSVYNAPLSPSDTAGAITCTGW